MRDCLARAATLCNLHIKQTILSSIIWYTMYYIHWILTCPIWQTFQAGQWRTGGLPPPHKLLASSANQSHLWPWAFIFIGVTDTLLAAVQFEKSLLVLARLYHSFCTWVSWYEGQFSRQHTSSFLYLRNVVTSQSSPRRPERGIINFDPQTALATLQGLARERGIIRKLMNVSHK